MMHDQAGLYDTAFAAVMVANRLAQAVQIRSGEGFDRDQQRRTIDWAINTFTKDRVAATADWGDPSDAPVFIVGMPRSGTTLVEQIAASHPRVVGTGARSDIRDIVSTLFSSECAPQDWDRTAIRQAASGHIARLNSFGSAATRVIDSTPDNCLILGQIAVLFPNARNHHLPP